MNLLNRQHPTVALLAHERFFLELWFGMTHELSLDSHRVRCLNARTIIRELDQELCIALRTGRLKPDEFQELCAEADDILARDPLVASSFARHIGLVQPLVKNPPQFPDEKKKDAAVEQKFREVRFVVADFSVALGRDYFKHLVAMLPDTIVAADNQKTEAVVGALLSDLVDQGWPLETLFSWVELFFQKKKLAQYDTFAANLRFLIQQLSWGKQDYKVILRLSGSSKLSDFGDFAGFNFRPTAGFVPTSGHMKKLAFEGPATSFAETNVKGVDFISAAISAREKFEVSLDQMRFNFLPSPLKVEDRCYVKRSDGRNELVTVRHLVPNPHHHLEPNAFREFADDLTKKLGRTTVEPESRERVEAAIRHYRFGSDADTYKDKFLNWWMGLEFLAHVTDGDRIGQTVARHANDALLQRYFYRLVSDIVRTIKAQEIAWDADLIAGSGAATLNDLEYPGALKVLQAPALVTKLAAGFPNNPVAAMRIEQLAATLQDPKKTADALVRHQKRLLWQLGRLYRIRCCIVHGSAVRFKLPLFTANMEFYLKELIIVCLRSLTLNPHVVSLREVFQRAAFARQRLDAELRVAPPNPDAVRNAVFNSVVIQENF
jgi:hypothetical protein